MANCKNCGAELEEGVKFCPSCGTKVEEEQEETEKAVSTETAGEEKEAKESADEKADNTLMGVLSYLSILVLIPLILRKESDFVRFHANQGLILFIGEVILGILTSVFSWVPVLPIVLGLLNIVFFVFSIIGIINVVNEKKEELPLIGKIRIIK